ncbi:MAG TPA: hypothetical protein VG125_05900, partial [Pirellulales bacterium]|nr:hypothetical protein [Pirellulales bacterium]
MPRRTKALLGLFVFLLLVAAGWGGYRWNSTRKHAAHWQAMVDRHSEFTKLNGPPLTYDNRSAEQQAAAAPAANRVAGPAASIEPVHLLWKESDWEGRLLSSIDGCLPIGSGKDLVWSGADLFLLSEPGRIDRISSSASVGPAMFGAASFGVNGRPCFDGRYVWLLGSGRGGRQVMVVDPATRHEWEFGSQATGLFREDVQGGRSIQVALAPARPGVVCAFIAAKDSWLAMLHFDPAGKREVDVIELPRGVTLGPHVGHLFTLEATVEGKKMRRIIVGREDMPALILDPETNQVSVAGMNSTRLAYLAGRWCVDQGTLWWQIKSAHGDTETILMRATLPEMKEEAVLTKVPSALLAPLDGGLVLVGPDCWQWKGTGAELGLFEADAFWTFVDTLLSSQEVMTPVIKPRADVAATLDDLFRAAPDSLPAKGRSQYKPAGVFPSNVYGLLLAVSPRTGGQQQMYRIAIADAAAEAPAPKVAPPRAFTTSRFSIAKPAGDGPDQAWVAVLDAAVEPVRLPWRERLPVLARELVRQSLWLAARSELGGTVADGALGEASPDLGPAAREFRLSSSFRADGSAEVSLQGVGADGSPTNWRQELRLLNRDGMLDYASLAETAEAWSRGEFLRQLAPEGTRLTNGTSDFAAGDPGAEQPSAEVEAALNEMTFPAQFAAVRACSRQSAGGIPDKALGALVRGYANLGLLTEHHWDTAYKTFQARALLYAQRMVMKNPTSPEGLWHRAYAEALAGLPGAALGDLDKAQKLESRQDGEQADEDPPAWVAVIAAACRNDDDALAAYGGDPQAGQLAALLRFLQLTWLRPSVLTMQAAESLLERQPNCLRAYHAMCDVCEVDDVRKSTAAALTALDERLPARVRQIPGLPPSVVKQLDADAEKSSTTERLAQALLEATENDSSDLSWQALGSLLNEALFAQTWRHAHFLRFQVNEDTEEFLAKAAPRVARHRCGRLLDFYADVEQLFAVNQHGPTEKLDDRRKSAVVELLRRVDLGTLTEVQQRLYDYFFGEAWQVQRPEEYVAASSRPAEHRDGVMRDLLGYQGERSVNLLRMNDMARNEVERDTIRQLNALNPGNPEAVAVAVRYDRGLAEKLSGLLLDKYPKQPHVLQSLASTLGAGSAQGQRIVSEYIKLSPDAWAYEALARAYLDGGRIEQWQALLDEYLSRQPNNEQAAQTRVGMANVFISRGEWEKALPYAEAAAAKKSEEAMACLIRCYQGLGDEEEEGVWHERIVDRHPSGENARERYLWSRRTGLGDAKGLGEEAAMRLGAGNAF